MWRHTGSPLDRLPKGYGEPLSTYAYATHRLAVGPCIAYSRGVAQVMGHLEFRCAVLCRGAVAQDCRWMVVRRRVRRPILGGSHTAAMSCELALAGQVPSFGMAPYTRSQTTFFRCGLLVFRCVHALKCMHKLALKCGAHAFHSSACCWS